MKTMRNQKHSEQSTVIRRFLAFLTALVLLPLFLSLAVDGRSLCCPLPECERRIVDVPEGYSWDEEYGMYTSREYGEWILRIRKD